MSSKCQPINAPADCEEIWRVPIVIQRNGLSGNLFLDKDEAAAYNADPDLYAAKYLGFETAEEYREWIKTDCCALCSERTKHGRACQRQATPRLSPPDWKRLHRNVACRMHSNAEGRS